MLSDLYFGDTDKIATAIIVNETPVLVERIASVDAQGVILLPDGKKRVRKQKSKPVIEKPEKDFKVSILSPPENALSLPAKALSNYGFLIGRVATSSVYDRNNVPIVKKGALVTKKSCSTPTEKTALSHLPLQQNADF